MTIRNGKPKAYYRSLFCLLFLLLLLSQDCSVGAVGSIVKYLPGFEGPLPFELETGYIGVDESEDVQLFYYFVKSQSNPQVDPLVIWLTGGPGCSALTGLAYEIGPITFETMDEYNGSLPRLVLNPYSWTAVASIIFVDMPVGTGFSYARTPNAIQTTGLQACDQVDQFVRKFIVDHPEYISNPFYVGGDSFSGLWVPVIVELISQGNQNGIQPSINLEGYLLGNPLTSSADNNYQVPYSHGMGIIPDDLYESLNRSCKGVYQDIEPGNTECLHHLQTFEKLLRGNQLAYILESFCGSFSAPKPEILSSGRRSLHEKLRKFNRLHHLHTFTCRVDQYKLSYYWANDYNVREALHIRKGSIGEWERCNANLPFTNSVWDAIPYHTNLSRKGCRSLIFSGDHDMIVPFLATQAWIRSLNYPIIDDWRQWIVQGQVAGYTRTYANQMTFATVKGGGHTAAEYKPMECKIMFKKWIFHANL